MLKMPEDCTVGHFKVFNSALVESGGLAGH